MIILDENIIDSQRTQLINWGYHIKQIGYELGEKGVLDEAIIPLLEKNKDFILFTRDKGFYNPKNTGKGFSIAVLFINQNEVASFIRRFLKHSQFNTHAKRNEKFFILVIVELDILYLAKKEKKEQIGNKKSRTWM